MCLVYNLLTSELLFDVVAQRLMHLNISGYRGFKSHQHRHGFFETEKFSPFLSPIPVRVIPLALTSLWLSGAIGRRISLRN